MKKKLISKTGVFSLLLFITSATNAQEIKDSLVNGGAPGEHHYSVEGLSPSQNGAFFSYLWWFGDNGFAFTDSPNYAHSYRYAPDDCKMLLALTENYGTAGPPPMVHIADTYTNNGTPHSVLQPGNAIYLQHYRNAVRNDIMYLILTYKNIFSDTPESGTLRLDLDPQVELVDTFITNHPELHPNHEQKVSGLAQWSFDDLKYNEERSILIPVKVSPNAKDEVKIVAHLKMDSNEIEPWVEGISSYEVATNVEVSHDPNKMLEISDENRLCSVRGDTIEYHIDFQNIGGGPTRYVSVVCHLDDKVDLSTISHVAFPPVYRDTQISEGIVKGFDIHNDHKEAIWEVDETNRTITFEMNQMVLRSLSDSTCTDLETTRSQVSFKIKVDSNYYFGDPTWGYSEIVFDDNDTILTDSVFSGCINPVPTNGGNDCECIAQCRIWWCYIIIVALVLIIIAFLLGRTLGKRKRKKRGFNSLKN